MGVRRHLPLLAATAALAAPAVARADQPTQGTLSATPPVALPAAPAPTAPAGGAATVIVHARRLPRTGADLAEWVLCGALLIVAGAATRRAAILE